MKKYLIFCVVFLILVGCDNTMFDQRVDTCSDKKLTLENVVTQNINQVLQFDEKGNIVGVNMHYAVSPEDVIEEISEYNRDLATQQEMIKANSQTRFLLYLLFLVVGIVIGRISCKRVFN